MRIGTHGRRLLRLAMARHPDPWRGIVELAYAEEEDGAPVRLCRQLTDRHIVCGLNERLANAADAEVIPERLAGIPDAPLALTYRGNRALLDRPAVALVGARRCSVAGAEIAHGLGRALADQGIVVISGLARGIDAAAHRGALGSEHPGHTIAVMGRGLDQTYPVLHEKLAKQILESGGLLVSEYPPTTPPFPANFPERNRLISGLSMGVVVVEATLKSGSLITARLALEQGRDVMAVPGPVGQPISEGCHRLIQQGAALITTPLDVLQTLGLDVLVPPPPRLKPNPEEAELLAALPHYPTSIDVLAHALERPGASLVPVLVELELKGFVRQLAQGYIRTPFREM